MGSSSGFTSRRPILIASAAAVAAAALAVAVLPAVADGGPDGGQGKASSALGVQHGKGHGGQGGHGGQDSSSPAVTTTDGTLLAASLNGANEVPNNEGKAVGDKDGAALQFVKVSGDKVSFAVKWRGTAKPTALHLHQGAKGVNGGIKVDFTELLAHAKGHSATGTVTVKDQALLGELKANPGGFYANLHTAEFPGGAVRGQLHKVTDPFDFRRALANFQAAVVKGEQIYECKAGQDGSLSFQQRDVRAVLAGRIDHSFVAPNSGTPQWIAPDGSAVKAKLISRTPNGETNIPELALDAEQTGKPHGLLAHTTEILRLNTVGGVAPSGACEQGDIVRVPYKADYVFVQD
ncbi:CHRD domain-containing protein [Streptomyces sp. TRM66268-LWL]|uniref:CHRD domain-containing protein n=1 Tax=Streptomyces polyasparticus TaxID=2767826 RepID=A0ABR7SUG8_9ACTN|nr:CHRD domain-containing protein [Streptomyces polyasparticus]MBC9718592.1 CHRD domain-containing protein [Streptomyces polyasparticus]